MSAAVLEQAVERFAGRRTALGDGLGQRFAVLPSCEEPRCLLPVGNSRTTLEGFRFYTPRAFGARLLKGLLSGMVKTGWNGWPVHSLYVGEPLGLKVLITNVTGERSPVFAMLLGAPGRYRKLTIQVMRPGGQIIGYVKLGLSRAAGTRVRHEAAILEELPALRPYVPRVLYSGAWQDSYLLFQSPVEGQPGPAELSGMHVEFLEKLAATHRVNKPGLRVVEEVGVRWNEVAWRCTWRDQQLGAATLAEARRELEGVMVPCGVAHGDFAPWNTRIREGRLAVFDWESGEWEAPLGWDAFHFSVQVANRVKKGWRAKFELTAASGARGLFLLYLLASLARTLDEQADFDGIEYRRVALADELAAGLLLSPELGPSQLRLTDFKQQLQRGHLLGRH